ncbi:baseplate J/gp47 family protein [Escherichia coli]|uniref:baseplate J/gp47 family protein n=1 Tax=Escherichia coli TaxID=562 RepID=UPI000DA5DA43|nr:baseplate J/gp47 family protein [Escherichia coli]EFF0540581.1 baseplate J/gp47 family protein [Escherichia coli]EFL6428519.1 baseplate J/gp47 family protein [Escherichia coli]MCU0038350.1 baseplate J/gp47 family protein [Escherichia coli]MQJ25322.1 baseplate J/gp47 family protein [Escherichia coli]SQY55131.1 baseplate J protein [Escherichia coli]
MPFKRKTLSELREENRQFMQAELDKVGALLRFGNLKVLADMDAGMAHLHYAYLDYIARQCTPFTSTDEWLAGWMALKQTYRKAATAARSPAAAITGTPGRVLAKGYVINRADGYKYITDASATIGPTGSATVAVTASLPDVSEDVTGGGSQGNADAGTILTLDANVPGINSAVMLIEPATGGADIESEEDFRQRGLLAFQNPPQGGSDTDYKGWALSVSGVTRAWVKRRINGAGTVGIYIMCDGNQNDGFPQGRDGISQLEEWGAVKATGDQLSVADYIYPLQTDTAIVFVCSPIRKTIDFEIAGIKDADSSVASKIKEVLASLFFDEANPDGTGKIDLSDINKNISNVDGTRGYILNSPSTNITFNIGEIPVLGEVIFV